MGLEVCLLQGFGGSLEVAMRKADGIKLAKDRCPAIDDGKVCGGDIMLNYKSKFWLGKCLGCSRIWRMKGERLG